MRQGSVFSTTSPALRTSRASMVMSPFGFATQKSARPCVRSSSGSVGGLMGAVFDFAVQNAPLHDPQAPFFATVRDQWSGAQLLSNSLIGVTVKDVAAGLEGDLGHEAGRLARINSEKAKAADTDCGRWRRRKAAGSRSQCSPGRRQGSPLARSGAECGFRTHVTRIGILAVDGTRFPTSLVRAGSTRP